MNLSQFSRHTFRRSLVIVLVAIVCVCLSVRCSGQGKWKECGTMYWKDTVTRTYQLGGKDSISYHIGMSECKCDFYLEIGTHDSHSCKGLQRHFMETIFWNYEKSITFIKGVKISETKPKWESNWSMGSTIDGTFTIDNKLIQPSAYYYKGKKTQINEY